MTYLVKIISFFTVLMTFTTLHSSQPTDKEIRKKITEYNNRKIQGNKYALSFSYFEMNADQILLLKDVVQNNKDLKKLDLYKNNLKAEGVKNLESILNGSNLEVLDLGFNQIDINGLPSIIKIIQTNIYLKIINLDWNIFGPTAIEMLSENIQNSSLEEVRLKDDFKYMTDKSVKFILKFLSNNRKIKELYIRGDNIGPDGTFEILSYIDKYHYPLEIIQSLSNTYGPGINEDKNKKNKEMVQKIEKTQKMEMHQSQGKFKDFKRRFNFRFYYT